MKKLPDYAAHVPFYELVSITCRAGCGNARRWAQLMPAPPGIRIDPSDKFLGRIARCLKCGADAHDRLSWVQ